MDNRLPTPSPQRSTHAQFQLPQAARKAITILLAVILLATTIVISLPPLRVAHAATCAGIVQIPGPECTALLDLYNNTNGPGWITSTNWFANLTPCGGAGWSGLTCNGANTSVIGISLFSNNLVGPLPPTLTGLTNLTFLILNSNQLTGPLPNLSSLAALTILQADVNQLSGSLPPWPPNLVNMSINANQLNGPIPALPASITHVGLANNQLSGPFPALPAGVIFFDIGKSIPSGNNQITGSIGPLPLGLQIFYVDDNQLTGNIPSLAGLAALQQVTFDRNQLTGNIPSLAGLTSLQLFRASSNQLTGPLPALSASAAWTDFELALNQLSGTIPVLPASLTFVSLRNNQFTGTIPTPLPPNITLFRVSTNQLTGTIPAALPATLTFFDVANNQLTGTIPASLTGTAIPVSPQQLFLCGGSNTLTPATPAVNTFAAARIPGWTGGCPSSLLAAGGPTVTPAALPLCADTYGHFNPLVRVSVPPGAVNGVVLCGIAAENGQYVAGVRSYQIGPESVIDACINEAVDITGWDSAGNSLSSFNAPVKVCLKGEGNFVYLDVHGTPRTPSQLNPTYEGGFTCAAIPDPGMVVLTARPLGEKGDHSQLSAPPNTTGTTGNSNVSPLTTPVCRITMTTIVNLRSPADGSILDQVPYNTTLRTTSMNADRSAYLVVYGSHQGYVLARYVLAERDCNNLPAR